VLNLENPWLARFSEVTSSPILWFSKRDGAQVAGALAEAVEGAFYQAETDEIIHVRRDLAPETFSLKGLNLPAEFQRENIMAALCAVRAVGVTASSIHRTKATVGGVSLELVHETSGIPSFDDSNESNPRFTA
jgi:UDP-N-acetylmuramoylalanine-D-glutamate ligase